MKYCWLLHNFKITRYECVSMKACYVTYIDQGTQKRARIVNLKDRKHWFGTESHVNAHRSRMIAKHLLHAEQKMKELCAVEVITDEIRKEINTTKNDIDYLKSL